MKTLWSVVLVVFCLCPAVMAKEFRLPDAKPVATINVPDAWKPVPIEKGVQGQTADNSVYLSVETADTAQGMSGIVDDTFAVLKEHSVDLDHHVQKENKFLINGLPADELLYDGKDAHGPTMVSITFVNIGKTTLVLTYWASTDGTKKHQSEVGKILATIKAIK